MPSSFHVLILIRILVSRSELGFADFRPAEIERAIGTDLVKTFRVGRVRCSDHELRIVDSLASDLDQNIDEVIEFFLRFSFRWFDHQRFRNNQWEIGSRRVDTEIEHPLGHIEGANAELFLSITTEYELMHAGSIEGDIEMIAESRQQVIC